MGLFGNKKKKEETTSSGGSDSDDFFDLFGGDESESEIKELDESLNREDSGYLDSTPNREVDEYGEDEIVPGIFVPGAKNEDEEKEDLDKRQEEYSKKVRRILMFAVPVIIVLVAVVVMVTGSKGSDSSPEGNTQEQSNSSMEGQYDGIVVDESVGKAFVSHDNGNPSTGTGAIMAFDYAYYQERDAGKALKFFNPKASEYGYTEESVQQEIDKVAQGTTYDLSITPKDVGSEYEVNLSLKVPGFDSVVYKQKFKTAEENGVYYVKTFTTDLAENSEE